jgi:hypothetical protein
MKRLLLALALTAAPLPSFACDMELSPLTAAQPT